MKISLSSFFRELARGKSTSRSLLVAALAELFRRRPDLSGSFSVLELGSEPASHQRIFPSAWRITRANLAEGRGADPIFDANRPFPFPDGSFDAVVFFNTLYAIESYAGCVREAVRISRRFILFNAPHIAAFAPHPSDHHRFTVTELSALCDGLVRADRRIRYGIIPVGGSFTAAMSVIDPYFIFRIFRIPPALMAAILDLWDRHVGRSCPVQHLVLIEKIIPCPHPIKNISSCS